MARVETWSNVNVRVKRPRKVTRIYRALTLADVVPERYLLGAPKESMAKRVACVDEIMRNLEGGVPAYARETVRAFLRDIIVDGDPMSYLPLIDYAREVGADALADVVVNTFSKACRAVLEKSSAPGARAVMLAWRAVCHDAKSSNYVMACAAIIAEYMSRRQTAPKAAEVKG